MPDAPEERPAKDTRFNPSRIPVSDRAKAVVGEIRGMLLNYERYYELRRRARRPADQERFDRMVTAILCDLMHAALVDPLEWRHISLSKRHRGTDGVGAHFMTEDRRKVIQWMTAPEMDWLELEKGGVVHFGRNRQSRIRASARLRDRMDKHAIQFDDISHDWSLMGDPIVLRSAKVRGRAKNLYVPSGQAAGTCRSEMLRINKALARAQISSDFVRDGNLIDTGDRWMRRIFNNNRLDHGGRLYGGFWQTMSEEDRLSDIQLNGEPVASLDFDQCAVRTAYGLAGAQPPEGDLYCVPGLERYRDGVKVVLNAMLARSGEMARRPAGSGKRFPRDLSLREIEEPIFRHHHAIRHLCYRGAAWELQFIESQVLVRALLQLIEHDIPALPIHDCVLVPSSAAVAAERIMLQSFKDTTGVEGSISTLRDTSVSPIGIYEGSVYGGYNHSPPSPPHKRGA